jgi:uncharacterized protein YhdP
MDVKTCILDSIPKGEANRITRGQLLWRVNQRGFAISDRTMRMMIADLRANDSDGAWIVSDTDGGYWLAESLAELDDCLRQDAHRAHEILARIKGQQEHARYSRVYNQQGLF